MGFRISLARGLLTASSGGCVVAMTLVAAALAQPPAFAPADFAMPNELVKIAIDRRDIGAGNTQVLIRCQGFVAMDGMTDDVHCVSSLPGEHTAYVEAVLDAVPRQAFAPARVDDEPVRVYMSFAVLFICADGACQAIPVRNHGDYFEQFGLAYIAPQPILPDDDWYAGFEQKLEWTRDGQPTLGDLTRERTARGVPSRGGGVTALPLGAVLAVDIGIDGTASGASLLAPALPGGIAGTPPPGPGAPDPLAGLGGVRFIPGFQGPTPVSMRYVEQTITYAGR